MKTEKAMLEEIKEINKQIEKRKLIEMLEFRIKEPFLAFLMTKTQYSKEVCERLNLFTLLSEMLENKEIEDIKELITNQAFTSIAWFEVFFTINQLEIKSKLHDIHWRIQMWRR